MKIKKKPLTTEQINKEIKKIDAQLMFDEIRRKSHFTMLKQKDASTLRERLRVRKNAI